MGRIKTKLIKSVTLKLFRMHREAFTESFEDNKKKVSEFAEIPSKKIRNIIAGYVTRLSRSKQFQ